MVKHRDNDDMNPGEEEKLIVFCIPSLVATLISREREKGSALTEEEVIEIRDNAPAKRLTLAEARAVEARRGYHDIDPERCWEEWQVARLQFQDKDSEEEGEQEVDVSAPPTADSGDGESQLIVFIDPSLIGLLFAREQEKGSPLTEEEVLEIRDNSAAIVLVPEDVREREAARGFTDIDPERCWEEWQEVRLTLREAPRG